jgi:ABC-2 type transport system permease protein
MILFQVNFTIYILEAIVPLLMLLILSIGVGMILATLAVFFRDLEYLWGVLLMLIMYASAIFYDVTSKKMIDKLPYLQIANPLFDIITNFRDAVFGRPLDQKSLIISAVYSLGAFIIGIILFYRKQDDFILNI